MRSVLPVAILALASHAVLSAQLPVPRDLKPLVRRIPTVDMLLRGEPPLSTGFDDTAGAQPMLDGVTWGAPRPLTDLPRTANGGFRLQPGYWEGTFQSFCLRTAAYSPGKGEGYLYGPYRGSKAGAIRTILVAATRRPEVDQGDIQMLLWGILSRSKIQTMAPKLRATAQALLTAEQIRDIDRSALDLIPASERARLFRQLPAGVREVAEQEAELRYRFSRGVTNYDEIQRVAVRAGVAPEDENNKIARGQWARHPAGFWIRYFPSGFMTMRVEVMVPGHVEIRRDHLNRIISIEDATGRTETTYDDTIPPRALAGSPDVKAYAFKTIRFVPAASGDSAPEAREIHNRGYTFVRSAPRVDARASAGASADSIPRLVRATFVAAQDPFERWAERGERAREAYERYDYYRDRAEAATADPSADSVDDLGNIENYRDGVDAALGDSSDRAEWMIEQQERQNAALRWATAVLDSLPTTSSPDWEPSDGMAVPSGGGQRLGISGRAR